VCSEDSRSNGTARRHAREGLDSALEAVQESERRMDIDICWEFESKEWEDAASLVSTRKYRLCINELEKLVLKRMFELTKMNMSGTGEPLPRNFLINPIHVVHQATK
jgi:hypothetical protein